MTLYQVCEVRVNDFPKCYNLFFFFFPILGDTHQPELKFGSRLTSIMGKKKKVRWTDEPHKTGFQSSCNYYEKQL